MDKVQKNNHSDCIVTVLQICLYKTENGSKTTLAKKAYSSHSPLLLLRATVQSKSGDMKGNMPLD
jgi:hypothetical protein